MGGPSPSVWGSHQTPLPAQAGLGLQSRGVWRSSGQELAETSLLLSAPAASATATARPGADGEQDTQAGGGALGPGRDWWWQGPLYGRDRVVYTGCSQCVGLWDWGPEGLGSEMAV